MTGLSTRRRITRPGAERGFTLIELMVVVAIVGILSAIAIPLYGSAQLRVRVARAQADVRAIASAITLYQTHMGAVPPGLGDLTAPQVNPLGQSAGPFLASVPSAPAGWTPYAYVPSTADTWTLTASGDGTTVTIP